MAVVPNLFEPIFPHKMCLALFQSAKSIFFGRTKSKPIEWIIENEIMKVIVVLYLYCNWIFQKLILSLWPYLCTYFFGYDNCSSRDLLWAEKSPDDQDFLYQGSHYNEGWFIWYMRGVFSCTFLPLGLTSLEIRASW